MRNISACATRMHFYPHTDTQTYEYIRRWLAKELGVMAARKKCTDVKEKNVVCITAHLAPMCTGWILRCWFMCNTGFYYSVVYKTDGALFSDNRCTVRVYFGLVSRWQRRRQSRCNAVFVFLDSFRFDIRFSLPRCFSIQFYRRCSTFQLLMAMAIDIVIGWIITTMARDHLNR